MRVVFWILRVWLPWIDVAEAVDREFPGRMPGERGGSGQSRTRDREMDRPPSCRSRRFARRTAPSAIYATSRDFGSAPQLSSIWPGGCALRPRTLSSKAATTGFRRQCSSGCGAAIFFFHACDLTRESVYLRSRDDARTDQRFHRLNDVGWQRACGADLPPLGTVRSTLCSLLEPRRPPSPFPTRTAIPCRCRTSRGRGCCCGGTPKPRHPAERFRVRRCVTVPLHLPQRSAPS